MSYHTSELMFAEGFFRIRGRELIISEDAPSEIKEQLEAMWEGYRSKVVELELSGKWSTRHPSIPITKEELEDYLKRHPEEA